MTALYLLILSAIVNCSVGYTIVERPAKVDEKEFSYNRIPSGVVQSRPPTGFWFQQHPYNLPKSDSQALFELYYLTQVITIYRRHHPRAHRSHLDALVEELQDDGFQQKIRQALQGIKELDVLKAYADLNLQDYAPFVNDRRQLIPAIHRTLNEIQLGQIKDKSLRWTLERLKEESTALTVKMARKEAEVLRELIDSNRKVEKAWTVSDILAAVFGKQDEDTMKDFEQKYEVVDDGKPIDDGKVEEFWVVFEDDKREESTTKAAPSSAEPETKPFQFVDDNYEQYEAKQEVEVDAKEESAEQSSEPKEVEEAVTIEEVQQSLEQDSEPKEEVEAGAEEEVESLEPDTAVEREDTVAEEETIEESLEQESTVELDGEQRIETDGFEFKAENYESDQDYERTVPEEDDQGLVEEVVAEEELPDSVPEELQTLDASVEVVEEPEPEYTEEVEDELPSLEDSAKIEEQPEPAFTEELQNQDDLVETEEQLESESTEEINEELQSVDGSLEVVEVSEPGYTDEVEENLQSLDDSVESEQPELTEELVEEIPEPAAAKASQDSITFPEDPNWVEDSVRPLGSSGATGLDSVYNPEEVETPVTQSVPLWISKGYATEYEGREVVDEEEFEEVQQAEVYTNDLESRAEPTETVEIDQETLRYVAFEILKVVSLLEDNAGFTGLRDQITTEDVDRLIEQLSVEQFVGLIDEQGINRVEMINALERLIVEKNLENSGEILEVLEQWKQDPSEISDDLESFPVDQYQPDMQQLVPLIVEQLRLGNISEQEQETLARIFEDTWPLMVAEATRTDDRRIDAQMQGIVENLNSLV
ncbi:probable serine/threonine-protein kinase kinX [Culex quinquefasciatus]|uniref:probable serine/threonine-protein kinase kinX n=1 Tax=Culex quinquefasciatus TaxID=7176 RepID=UPI0018E3DB35|nr:probable serine/threonine-protein kinase kinX [Culex quinquefasciatus]